MSKAFAFGIVVVCATVFLGVSCALEKANIVRNLTISTSNASTVPFNGQLYTISKNQSHIHINSSDINYKPCNILINAAKDVTQGRLEIASTDEEIFIVGVNHITENEHYKYTILRVDPIACSYKAAAIPETNNERGDYFFPRLVRHRTGTDVFFPSLQNCAPCRLNDVGLRTKEAIPQISQEESLPYLPFHLRFAESMNSYFYVYNSFNYTTFTASSTMKLLDGDNFSSKMERVMDSSVHAVSKQKKSNEDYGVCFKSLDRRVQDISAYSEVRCDKLNSNLETNNTVRIPIEPHSNSISRISYEFDQENNSYVSFAVSNKLRLYIHDKDGKLVKAIDMGVVDSKFEYYPDFDMESFDLYNYWNVRGYLVGDEYCIVTEQLAETYKTPLHEVRCIDVKKYVKHQ